MSAVTGFAVHDTLNQTGRLALTAGLVIGAWWGSAWAQGLMDEPAWPSPWAAVRLVWAMVLAVSLAVVLRGLVLGQPVNPFFPLVMSGVSAVAVLVWRRALAWWCARSER